MFPLSQTQMASSSLPLQRLSAGFVPPLKCLAHWPDPIMPVSLQVPNERVPNVACWNAVRNCPSSLGASFRSATLSFGTANCFCWRRNGYGNPAWVGCCGRPRLQLRGDAAQALTERERERALFHQGFLFACLFLRIKQVSFWVVFLLTGMRPVLQVGCLYKRVCGISNLEVAVLLWKSRSSYPNYSAMENISWELCQKKSFSFCLFCK